MPLSLPCSPEDQLLLLLVQRRRSAHDEVRIQALLEKPLDWSALLHQADAHWVTPLLAPQLQRLSYSGIPPAVVAEFQQRVRLNRIRNMLLVQEFRRVLRRLITAGIPVIPLKGVALADALYSDYTLRVCTDLDLLIPQTQVLHAVRCLEAAGYQVAEPWEQWTASLINIEIALKRWDTSKRYDVDLHWGLMGGDPRNADAVQALWAAARPTTVLGVEAWAMCPEWELLSLVLHAARHQWQGLKWLVDLQAICWTWELDWKRVWAIAQRWEWEEILRLAIGVCQTLWDLPPLPGAPDVSCPAWLPRFPAPPHHRRWPKLRTGFLLFPRWGLRLGYVLRLISMPTPNDYAWLPLPVRLFPLYILLRPLRFMLMVGKQSLTIVVRRLSSSRTRQGFHEMDPPLDGSALRSHNGEEVIPTIAPEERVP